MNEQEKQETQKILRRSEFLKSAESFAKYAHKEWIEGNTEDKAMLMCCVDTTVADEQTGLMSIVMGGKDLLETAMVKMMENKTIGELFVKARIASDVIEEKGEKIKNLRKRLRTLYGMAALAIFWTMCIIGFAIWGVSDWITTITNLLLMAFVGLLVGREIKENRRLVKCLEESVQRDIHDHLENLKRGFFDFLRKLASHNEADDDDDD